MLVGLNFGGTIFRWDGSKTFGPLVSGAVLLFIFPFIELFVQRKQKRQPIVALYLFKYLWDISLTAIVTLLLQMSYIISLYYVPIYFQARGASIDQVGLLLLLPSAMTIIFGFGGTWVSTIEWCGVNKKTMYYIVLGACMQTFAAGLLFAFVGKNWSNWVISGIHALLVAGNTIATTSLNTEALTAVEGLAETDRIKRMKNYCPQLGDLKNTPRNVNSLFRTFGTAIAIPVASVFYSFRAERSPTSQGTSIDPGAVNGMTVLDGLRAVFTGSLIMCGLATSLLISFWVWDWAPLSRGGKKEADKKRGDEEEEAKDLADFENFSQWVDEQFRISDGQHFERVPGAYSFLRMKAPRVYF